MQPLATAGGVKERTIIASKPLVDLQLRRPRRFIMVGLVSSLAYVGTMALAMDGLQTPVVAAAVLAFMVGTAVSYAGNSLWTFGAKMGGRNLARFVTVTLVGLGLNIIIAWTLGAMGIHYLLIALIILVIVPAWNFIGHAYWTYQ